MRKINISKKKIELFKLSISSVTLIAVLVVVLSTIIRPNETSGSIYNISDIERKIDVIQTGDTINYNINGNSNWKVLRKDEHNGTIDIVSETNVKDITFDYTNSSNALEILQNAADEYKNNSYAISARPISAEDAKLMVLAFSKKRLCHWKYNWRYQCKKSIKWESSHTSIPWDKSSTISIWWLCTPRNKSTRWKLHIQSYNKWHIWMDCYW